MRYWLVCCYVGHCGRRKHGNSREIALAIEAPDSVKALLIAKKFPGVKHAAVITYALHEKSPEKNTLSGEKLARMKKHYGKTVMLIFVRYKLAPTKIA